jgi:hypothetical protein
MCCGLSIVDVNAAPWKDQPKKDVKPSRKDYADEVGRRSKILKSNVRPANWSVSQCESWLCEHPVEDEADVKFLKEETRRLSQVMIAASKETEEVNDQLLNGYWRGNIPHLRLILCLIQDDIKPCFIRRGAAMTRQQVDGRNSTSREPTVYEMISDRWNDSTFNPVTSPSSCHTDFLDAIYCSFSKVEHLSPATPIKVEKLLTDMRVNLL